MIAGIVRSLEDLFAQKVIEHKRSADYKRTLKMGFFGVFYWTVAYNRMYVDYFA